VRNDGAHRGLVAYGHLVNEAHLEFCASPEWRTMVEEIVLPAALRDTDLGSDVVEVGPGPGFTTDVLRTRVDQLTAVELDPDLAGALARRLGGTNVEVILGDATALELPTGRFTGAVSFNMLHHVPTDDGQDRVFAELARVLRAGGLFVAADSVGSDDLRAFHAGDTYNPIDPDGLPARLSTAGFLEIQVRTYDLGWTCSARAA
jgi:SAM-dependent methyltransferase